MAEQPCLGGIIITEALISHQIDKDSPERLVDVSKMAEYPCLQIIH